MPTTISYADVSFFVGEEGCYQIPANAEQNLFQKVHILGHTKWPGLCGLCKTYSKKHFHTFQPKHCRTCSECKTNNKGRISPKPLDVGMRHRLQQVIPARGPTHRRIFLHDRKTQHHCHYTCNSVLVCYY